jgi:hypothetical protein
MKSASTEGDCTYCGEWRELTHDHVPPRCLFSKPRPSDLVTVPCCVPCNRDAQKQDEYFRIAITAGIDAATFPRENADSVRAVKSLSRAASLGFARKLLQSYERNPAGLHIDFERIKIVLHRIVRGFFYHHTKIRLPASIEFACCPLDEPLNIGLGRETINRLEGTLKTIGGGNFRYAFEQDGLPDPFETLWLMRFYDNRTFFCVTATKQ